MNVLDFKKMRDANEKIVLSTCYSHWAAKLLNSSDVDALLVGDSVAMVEYGYDSTVKATIPMMVTHTEMVARGAPEKFVIADLPFLSYRQTLADTMQAVMALMQAGAHAIKLEGADGNLAIIEHIVASGVPVMGHIGLTPQFVHGLGGYRVQGRDQSAAERLWNEAQQLQQAGCFAVVLECVPRDVAEQITDALDIATIGIGAGHATSGQVLVFHDMLGFNDMKLRFVKRYHEGGEHIVAAMNTYASDVKSCLFPDEKTSFE